MIFKQLNEQLGFLSEMLTKISPEHYTAKSVYLGDVSIGQHTRHIIELWKSIVAGYITGEIDYDDRKRDIRIELDTDFAQQEVEFLLKHTCVKDKPIKLLAAREENGDAFFANSSYFREVVYNTEHTIHHMALIKVALREKNLDIVHQNFGMAYSTLSYKNKCVQ